MLLRRLSVFVAGRTLEMAEAVCAVDGLDKRDIFDLLCSLADKSLLVVDSSADGETRYTMLESIWDYADDKLMQQGEGPKFARRHLDYFVSFAEKAEPHLFGPDIKVWLDRVAREQRNLDRALRTSMDRPDTIVLGLRIAGALTRFWEIRNYLTEGNEQYTELLARADDTVPPQVRAKAELGAGRLSWAQDRDEAALRHYRAAQSIYQSLGMKKEVGLVEAFLGFVQRNEGNHDQARKHFEQARAVGDEIGSDRLKLTAMSGLSSAMASQGEFAQARKIKEVCLERAKALGDRWVQAWVTGALSKVCFDMGDLDGARYYITDALTIARDLGNNWSVPYAIEAIANIIMRQNQAAKAVRLYGAASAHRESLALELSPTDQLEHKNAMEYLHQAVPDEQFQEEWKQGQELGFQSAVNLALER